MIESIPKELENARTSIVDGIPIVSVFIKSNYDLLVAFGLVLPSVLLFMFSNFSVVPKLLLLGTSLFVVVLVLVLKIPKKVSALISLRRSLKGIGYHDDRINEFLPVKLVARDTLVLRNNSHVGVLETDGLNLHLYEGDHQSSIIDAYRTFLNSLDFPIQIISKSEPINVTLWLSGLDKRVKGGGTARKVYLGFKKFLEGYLEENVLKRRRYFIVFENGAQSFGFLENLKLLFGKGVSVVSDRVFEDLENKERVIVDMCRRFGIEARRLDSRALTNLIMSYYGDGGSDHEQYLASLIFAEEENVKGCA